jgi:putative transcriptional regulator
VEGLKGQLLIAGPGIAAGVFRQTVIVMAEHDDKGALGFVLNRPSHSSIGDLAPSLSAFPAPDDRIFLGGPVQPEVVVVLAEYALPSPPDKMIFDSIGFAPAAEPDTAEGIARAKVFAGYAGWGPGQLEQEIEDGGWITEPALPGDIFAPQPDDLWRDVVRRKGGEFKLLSTMPFDPTNN